MNVAAHVSAVRDLHGLLSVQVALDGAFDDDECCADAGLDLALGPNRDALRVTDCSLDTALDQQILFGGKLALETQRRTQHRHALRGRVVWVAHVVLPVWLRDAGDYRPTRAAGLRDASHLITRSRTRHALSARADMSDATRFPPLGIFPTRLELMRARSGRHLLLRLLLGLRVAD